MQSPVCRAVPHLPRMERVRRGGKKLDGENIPPDELSTAWTTADSGLSLHVPFGLSPLYPPKADICSALAHVRFGPIADMRAYGTVPRSAHGMQALGPESCAAESGDGPNTEKDYSLRRPECANYEVGSQAMSPKVKVEPARLVPRSGTYYEITRDDKIVR